MFDILAWAVVVLSITTTATPARLQASPASCPAGSRPILLEPLLQSLPACVRLFLPVLGLYGGADMGIPNDTVENMQKALKEANKPCEIVLYPDTPHGFHADYRPSYRKDKAEAGWKRLQEWFKKNGA